MSGIWLRRISDNKRIAEWYGCLHTSEAAKKRIAIMRRQEWWVWEFGEDFEEWIDNLHRHVEFRFAGYVGKQTLYLWTSDRIFRYTDSEGNEQEMRFLIRTERR